MVNSALRMFVKNFLNSMKYFFVPDKRFNKHRFKKIFKRKPDLEDPVTFSEKLIYLKMHYSNLLENVCADKFEVQQYVRQCGYGEILKETYQVVKSVEDIDLSVLPERFFIQCTHTQGSNYVIEKNDEQKISRVLKEYRQVLKRKHYKVLRENCYKHITPRIMCSEYLFEGESGLTDYKFYCFGGEAKYFMVSYGEFDHHVKNHKFDMNWNSIDSFFKEKTSVDAKSIMKPDNFEKMVEIVNKLAKPFPHVRVDLYNIKGRIVFGEMTFYSAGGFVRVKSREMDIKIGSWINLEDYKNYMV